MIATSGEHDDASHAPGDLSPKAVAGNRGFIA
jgi:hypothetical protein